MAKEIDDIYNSRAEFKKNETGKVCIEDKTADESQSEELVFAMKNGNQDFSLGLSTILSCLAIAEKEGYVPKLPEEWWVRLR